MPQAGRPRQNPTRKSAESGTVRHRTTGRAPIWHESSGLLIRGFGVQVPDGAQPADLGLYDFDHISPLVFLGWFVPRVSSMLAPRAQLVMIMADYGLEYGYGTCCGPLLPGPAGGGGLVLGDGPGPHGA